MSEGNHVSREGNRIIKNFGSHMDYVKEYNIYKRLQGTGLTARLMDSVPDTIEHEYIDGITLYDAILQQSGNTESLTELFRLFCVWYKSYRDVIRLSLGKPDFSKFILAEDRLTCIDFEHCKPGYAESDIARLLAQIAPVSPETAELFRKVTETELELDPEVLKRLENL